MRALLLLLTVACHTPHHDEELDVGTFHRMLADLDSKIESIRIEPMDSGARYILSLPSGRGIAYAQFPGTPIAEIVAAGIPYTVKPHGVGPIAGVHELDALAFRRLLASPDVRSIDSIHVEPRGRDCARYTFTPRDGGPVAVDAELTDELTAVIRTAGVGYSLTYGPL